LRHPSPLAAVLLGLTLAPVATADDVEKWNPDDAIRNGVALHVTQDGFDALGDVAMDLVPGLLPPDLISIPDFDLLGTGLSGAKLTIDFDPRTPTDTWPAVNIVPKASRPGGKLEAQVKAYVNIGSPEQPYHASCWFGADSGDGWMTVPATIKLPVAITVVTTSGTPELDLDVDTNAMSIELKTPDAHGSCAGTFGGVITALGNTVITALKPQIAPAIDDALAGLDLSAATIHQEVDVLGKTLFVDLEPLAVNSYANTPPQTGSNGGLELIYSTKFTAAQDPCVADLDPLGSLKTDNGIPGIGSTAPAHVGAYVADDMLNQALYAVFSGGMLCLNVDESLLGGTSLPIPIDSSLIPLIGGDGFNEILPADAQPLLIRTHPYEVPTADFGEPSAIDIHLKKLGVDFVTDLEYRQARVIGIAVSADVGADLDFDGTTGQLSVVLDGLAADAFHIDAVGDEFVAGTNDKLPGSMKNLLGTLLPLVLGSVTDSLSFYMPAFTIAEGVDPLGLTALSADVAGDAGDWLLAGARIGTVTYTPPADGGGGCGACGGCGGGCDPASTDCSSGCTTGNLGVATWLVVFLPTWILRRRKR
jgi:hypothetical protein